MQNGKIDFEKIYDTFYSLLDSKEWGKARELFQEAQTIYLIGNGGNLSTALHAASDIVRLTDKAAHAPSSSILLTSLARDHAYVEIFEQWLRTMLRHQDGKQKNLLIAYSGSGDTDNIMRGLAWAHNQKIPSILISGHKSHVAYPLMLEINLGVKYYHAYEAFSLMLFYDLIQSSGYECPKIKGGGLSE